MKMDDLQLPDMKALVAFGKIGMAMIASRMLSMTALNGVVALAAYSIYAASWIGAACTGIVAIFVFVPALKAESNRKDSRGEEIQ